MSLEPTRDAAAAPAAAGAVLTPKDAIRAFAHAGRELPAAAMQWALDHWGEAAGEFLQVLDDYAAGRDRSKENTEALFFILHVIGAVGETRAFPSLCRLLHDAEASEQVLGDAITETLRGIVIGAYDGDTAKLTEVIDDPAADDFVRDTLLLTMAYFVRTGRIADPDMRACLSSLFERLQPDIDEVVLCSCVMAAALLGYEDFGPRIEALFAGGGLEYAPLELSDFREILQQTLADPTGMAGFADENVGPLSDPIGALAGWDSFSGEPEEPDESWDDDDAAFLPEIQTEPLINPFRHVGRNDPCPCGSGKKYKKCCLT